MDGFHHVVPTRAEASIRVLGVRVDALQIPAVIARMEEWIREPEKTRYIAVTGMHGVTEAQDDPQFKNILNAADLVVPDGMPLVWLARLKGQALKRRVYGPELMLTFCRETAHRGYRHFFYGGATGVAETLAESLQRRFSGVVVTGVFSPPYRPLSPKEDEEITETLNRSGADILWVGLSTPKQERWMFEHRDRLNVPVLIGVGAAFDLNTGRVRQAPPWMREHGLEWLFRLWQEPRRLWRRYLIYGSKFVSYLVLEYLGLRRFD